MHPPTAPPIAEPIVQPATEASDQTAAQNVNEPTSPHAEAQEPDILIEEVDLYASDDDPRKAAFALHRDRSQ